MSPWQDDAPSWRDDEFWLDVTDDDLLDTYVDFEEDDSSSVYDGNV